MIILGVDPGLATTGFGVIKKGQGDDLKLITCGCILTPAKEALDKRLGCIFDDLKKIIEKHKPDFLVCEELFFFKNVKTAIAVAQARGVILLLARQMKIRLCEYTPLQIKQAITGYGRADKKQIQEMVKIILKLQEKPKPDDVADALAGAICQASCLDKKSII